MSHKLHSYEIWLGALYGLLQLFVLPTLAVLVNYYLQLPLWMLNCILFFINFICIVVIFHRFLWHNLQTALGAPWQALRYAGIGLIGYYILTAAVS